MQTSNLAPIKQANKLLSALPTHDWERWFDKINPVSLSVDEVLFESGQ